MTLKALMAAERLLALSIAGCRNITLNHLILKLLSKFWMSCMELASY